MRSDDPQPGDAAALDVTPRAVDAAAPRGPRRGPRRAVGVAVLIAVLAAGGYAVAQALNEATLFFRNVDEAVAERTEIGDERFRMQGLVVEGSVEAFPGGVAFAVRHGGVEADVEHTGDPEELFQPDVPVVLEGRWSTTGEDAVFLSDRMLVAHDETYEEGEPERFVDTLELDGDGAGYSRSYQGDQGDEGAGGADSDAVRGEGDPEAS